MILLPGIEAVPYYRWELKYGKLRLLDLHKHMLVFGLNTPEQIENLPSVNTGFDKDRYSPRSLSGILWLVPLIWAFSAVVFRIIEKIQGWRNKKLKIPVFIIIFSSLMLANAYPFSENDITQYGPDPGARPYQKLIDYVNSQGGLTFWAHPEAGYRRNFDNINPSVMKVLNAFGVNGIEIATDPYTDLLDQTTGYTGFAIFFEGARIVGNPQGLWDRLLLQYCVGNRAAPPWAISELELEGIASKNAAEDARTNLLVRYNSTSECLDALKKGRMYCFANYFSKWWSIKQYSVSSGDSTAISGEEINWRPYSLLTIELKKIDGNYPLNIVVIKDGKIYYNKTITGSEKLEVPLERPSSEKGYVRVVAYNDEVMRIATNPIFVTR
jgi:hypothetical protein